MTQNNQIPRRTVSKAPWVAGTAVILASATAPAMATSACGVTGGITVGPNLPAKNYRAICASQSQQLHPATIKQVYGNGELPEYLQICTCDGLAGWYRWKETDTLDNFQIEVDGVHSDQNSSTQGYRPSFYLSLEDACRQFALTYRTSAERSKTQRRSFTITWTLERSTGNQNGPWVQVQQITRAVSVIRTTGNNNDDGTNFNQCSSQGKVVTGKRD